MSEGKGDQLPVVGADLSQEEAAQNFLKRSRKMCFNFSSGFNKLTSQFKMIQLGVQQNSPSGVLTPVKIPNWGRGVSRRKYTDRYWRSWCFSFPAS